MARKKTETGENTKKTTEGNAAPNMIAMMKYRGKPTSVTLKEEYVMIFKEAFRGTKVKSVRAKGPVAVIDESTFRDCSALEGVGMPCVEVIGDSAFEGCVSLKTLTVPTDTGGVQDYLNEVEVGKLEIRNGVRSIGSRAFAGCDSVEEVCIPGSVEHIGERAFSGKKLVRFSVDESNPYFASDEDGVLFTKDRKTLLRYPSSKGLMKIMSKQELAPGKYEIPYGVEEIAPFAFEGCFNLSEIKISDSVKRIGREAFAGCDSIETIIISRSVEKIDERAFSGKKLSDFIVDEFNPYFTSYDGVLFSRHRKILLRYPPSKGWITRDHSRMTYPGEYVIPKGVEEIAPFAFEGCICLKNVAIPDGVKRIDHEAFTLFMGKDRRLNTIRVKA